ncbi:MAG TPA: hypothetical protein VKM55_18345, partial [Candidatus Lokiarchaeia archaeon]|nr:hypothetical protein [Candidatus Lokiarchaeia archaeon]
MKDAPFHETSGEPRDETQGAGIKILRDISRLLRMSTRRDAAVSHEPGTVAKASLMMISAIMLDSGLDDAKELLDSIQLILWTVLSWIIEATNKDTFLRALIGLLNLDKNPNALSVHRTTVTSMIPQADRSQLDEALTEQYKECVEELDEIGAKSSACIMVVDDTHEKVSSKYYNGNYSYVVVGQTSTWQRGFVYPTEFDSSHQLFMGSKHRDYRLIDSEKKGLRPWLLDVKAKVKMARELGIDQVFIEGDRAYFNAEIFASANLGLIDPGARPGHMPRVIVPRKFTREKDDYKWNYLLDNIKPQVFIDYINLNSYNNPALKQVCEGVFKKSNNGQFQIPYTCVAMIDEYSARQKRTLDEVRARARVVQDGIEQESINLKCTIATYMVINKAVNKDKAKEPSFGRGARRKKFADDKERRAYGACFKCNDRMERWKKEKARLLKTLMFFAISFLPGDDPSANPSLFIDFARDYHERWGIENGFRDVKARFLSKGRSRQPCTRQFRLVLGMMLYNRWEVERKKVSRVGSGDDPRAVRAFFEARVWIRRKHEKECHDLPTAVGFLVRNWCAGILSLMKTQM